MSLYECAYAENQMRPNRPSDDTLDMHAENQMCPNPSSDDTLDMHAENQMCPNPSSDDTLDMHAENQMCPNPSSDDILDSTKNCTVQQLTQSVQPTTADSQRVMVSIHGLLHWNIWQRANQSGSWPQRRCASASSNLHAFSMLHSLGVEPIHSCIRQPCCCQRKVGAFENSLKQKGMPQKCHVLNNEFLLCFERKSLRILQGKSRMQLR